MSLFWIILVTLAGVGAGTGLCLWLSWLAHEVETSAWIFAHILCPIVRILVLLLIVSQIYPAIAGEGSSLDFWRVLLSQDQFNHLVNLLFFGGLALSFIPVLSHPVIALPVQSLFTVAVVFHWQHAASGIEISLLPSFATALKILVYMLIAYFVTREASIHVARWLDRRFAIEGSIRLVADAIYLLLQIPVILIYVGHLKQQLP